MPSKIRGGTKDKHLADMHIPRVSALGAGGGAAATLGLKTNLVAWWELNEASGDRADSHTNALTLSDINTVTSNTGVGGVGTAAEFTAINTEFLSRTDEAALSTGDFDFAFAGWFYFTTLGAVRDLLSKWNTTGSQREYLLLYNSGTSRFEWYVSGDGSNSTTATANTFGAPTTGTWYFIYCYHDAANNVLGISVNNGAVDTTAHATGGRDGTAEFRLGARVSSPSYHNGRIAKVGFWKTVLPTAAQVTSLYNAGAGVTYAQL